MEILIFWEAVNIKLQQSSSEKLHPYKEMFVEQVVWQKLSLSKQHLHNKSASWMSPAQWVNTCHHSHNFVTRICHTNLSSF